MKILPEREQLESDHQQLRERVDAVIWELVYLPLVDFVRPTLPKPLRASIAPKALLDASAKELRNAGDDALRKALHDGVVQMVADHTGKQAVFYVAKPDRHISDALRAFGAKLDKRTGTWSCAPGQVPPWVRSEAQGYALRSRKTHDEIKKLLDELEERVDETVDDADMTKAVGHAVGEIEGGWKESAKALETKWDLGPAGQAMLAAQFKRSRGIDIKSYGTRVAMVDALQDSTKREVKVWAKEALARLRVQVEENAQQGYRSDGLADRIRNEYGVSRGRSDLIARQETNNFMANYRAARAADAGIKRYQWFCVRDSRTRKDHLDLHGKIFRYDQPPVTDTRTGARNNPGQDFRCRCVDRPVLE